MTKSSNLKFGDFVIFLCSSQNIWTCKIWIECLDIFWPETFSFQAGGLNPKQYRSCWIYNFLSGNLKILFRFNFDQIFILFSGCARNTWWAGSSDPKQYRSCWIYRWSIDDRWGWWWKQHPNLNRWSHVHDWKGILMGIFYEYLNFPCSLTLSSGPKIVLLYKREIEGDSQNLRLG